MNSKNFIETLLNSTNKAIGKSKMIVLYFDNHKKIIQLLFTLFFLLSLSVFFIFQALNENNTTIQAIHVIFSLPYLFFTIIFLCVIIVESSLLHNFNIKTYIPEIINNKITLKEYKSPLMIYKDVNRKKSHLSIFKIQPGPGLSLYQYISLKYLLLQEFYPEEKVVSKYGDKERFFDFIYNENKSNKEFERGSFRGAYNKFEIIRNDSIEKLMKANKKYTEYLLEDEVLIKKHKVLEYLQLFLNKGKH